MRSVKCALLVAAVVAATASPAQALTARTLSLSLAGTAGASVGASFSGTLSKTPTVGSKVYLQRKIGTTWTNFPGAIAMTTTAAGAYKGTFTTPVEVGTYTFRAYSSPTATLATAVSASRTTLVRVKLNATNLNPPSTTTLSGRVYPWKSGLTKPQLQHRASTTANFTPLANLSPASTGNFSFTPNANQLPSGQTRQYRVVLATSGGYAGTNSSTRPCVPAIRS